MKRKQIDAGGKVVEVDVPAESSPVVGAIGEPVTNPLEIPPRSARLAAPAPALGPWDEFLAQLAALHIIVARFIRRRVLLMPDIDMRTIEQNQVVIAEQHVAMSNMIAEVRLRLHHHERTIPMLGESRRRYEANMLIRAKRAEQKAADAIAKLAVQPMPAEAADHDGDDVS